MSPRKERILALYATGLYSYRDARRQVDREDIREAIRKVDDLKTRKVLEKMFDYITEDD